ncbi:hypothetical protein RYR54_003432 [Aeromonas sobria]|nr:hypothetical protein [Aeromonas sobria]
MYQYLPDIPDNIENVDFRAYMVESAYKYYMTAIKSSYNDISTKSVICALATEILLKSYNSEVANNNGRIDENYKFNKLSTSVNDPHDLVQLADAIPKEVRCYLLTEMDYDILTANRNLFKASRYLYEKEARDWYFDDIIDLTCELICKTILLYRKLGCCDHFIKFIDVNEIYFGHKQRFM